MDIQTAVAEANSALSKGRVLSKINSEVLRTLLENGRSQFDLLTLLQDRLDKANESLTAYQRRERSMLVDSRNYKALLAGVLRQVGNVAVSADVMEDLSNEIQMDKDVRTRDYLFSPIKVREYLQKKEKNDDC